MRIRVALVVLAVIVIGRVDVNAHPPGTIRLDGEFDDWTQLDEKVNDDPVGDATGGFDFSRVSTCVVGTKVYVHFDTQRALNLPAGPESEGTLRLRVDLSTNRHLSIDLRNRQASLTSDEVTNVVPWKEIEFAALPSYASTEFELQFDLEKLDVRAGDEVALHFEGSDQLASPIMLTMQPSVDDQTEAADLRKPPNAIRVASMNTLKQGAASATRAPVIKNLFEFADADVYCFNESLEEEIFRARCFDVLPEALAGSDNLHWAATCGIVSRYPLTPLPFRCREAAALIDVPGDRDLVVVSVHFKCCGFTGSREDEIRVREAEAVLSDLRRARNGEFGPRVATAGVIVLGDFNLVGSRTPLDRVNEAGMSDVMLRNPLDGSAITWRGVVPTEPFWPGRLDYFTVEQERVRSLGGYLMNAEQLGRLQPKLASEVHGTDHAMMVVDLKMR